MPSEVALEGVELSRQLEVGNNTLHGETEDEYQQWLLEVNQELTDIRYGLLEYNMRQMTQQQKDLSEDNDENYQTLQEELGKHRQHLEELLSNKPAHSDQLLVRFEHLSHFTRE